MKAGSVLQVAISRTAFWGETMDGAMREFVGVIDAAGHRYALLQAGAGQLLAWCGDAGVDAVPCQLVVRFDSAADGVVCK